MWLQRCTQSQQNLGHIMQGLDTKQTRDCSQIAKRLQVFGNISHTRAVVGKNVPLKQFLSVLFFIFNFQMTFTANLSFIQCINSHLNEEKQPPKISLPQVGTSVCFTWIPDKKTKHWDHIWPTVTGWWHFLRDPEFSTSGSAFFISTSPKQWRNHVLLFYRDAEEEWIEKRRA